MITRFNDHVFLLTEADEYVFDFMEKFDEREKVRKTYVDPPLILNLNSKSNECPTFCS